MTAIAELIAAAEPRKPRPLADLVSRLGAAGLLRAVVADGDPQGLVTAGVTEDSRAVRPGALFVAIPGAHVDGHRFVAPAAAAGAVAAIVEEPVGPPASRLVQLVVGRSRAALAEAAAWWYGDPSRELAVVGITGTDGKTSTSFLAAAALAAAGVRTGLVGTVATQVGGIREANLEHATTPGAPWLQAVLRAMVAAGDRAAVVETTSHGLAAERVRSIRYDIAILTNLSHEHLEFHGTFEAYRAAKASLFERLAADATNPPKPAGWPRTGIVNADDPAADVFAAATRAAGAHLLTYGAAADAAVRLLGASDEGGRLRVDYRSALSGPGALHLQLAGRFNAHNALAVVALGEAAGLDREAVRAGLESLAAVPGRMERVVAGQPFGVIVDYAHSPASLALVLDELGPIARATGGGLIAVFGSAGERDVAKRPMMGRIAAERCRLVVLTDEDPRGENREAILAQIAVGATAAGRAIGRDLLLIADRRAAIRAALGRAEPGDVVLLAGKGHEATIIGPDGAEPWDEAAEARAALAEMGWAAPA
ncbi:MAG TPA: UDP-N-acetylmuramoyl-L-alanyl-D-glutamate--2,6-diaminopimelate ligase [Candidatus Sulfomarinibacteraceae bacterium]|nr:UDP-N-acetylmuramoyl-L-alanyl-D-glutamate--2,6-diaminopimelate ligase [Candidatus Sulfomarinibacteraceae bacterium]